MDHSAFKITETSNSKTLSNTTTQTRKQYPSYLTKFKPNSPKNPIQTALQK